MSIYFRLYLILVLGRPGNIEFYNYYLWGGGGGGLKNEYFWGMKILWIFFWGHHKIGLI